MLKDRLARFRVHRLFESDEVKNSRSLIIEDVQGKRFFELNYYESCNPDNYVDVITAKSLQQIRELSDILLSVDWLWFDAVRSIRSGSLPGGASLEEAIEKSSAARQKFWERFQEPLVSSNDKYEQSPALEDILDNPYQIKDSDKSRKRLRGRIEVSGDDSSYEERIQRLSKEIIEKTKARKVYWKQTGASPKGKKCQVLTFES